MNPDELSKPTAGERDPVGAAAAEKNHTPQCSHPSASTLRSLSCSRCGVFIVDGRVIDRGRARDQGES